MAGKPRYLVEDGEKLTWTAHEARENPVKTVITTMAIIFFLVLVKLLFIEMIYVLVSAMVLIFSLARYYFPSTYILDENGVTVSFLGYTRVRQWTEFRRAFECPRGIHLSPYIKPHPLESTRGLYLICPSLKKEVLAFVRAQIENA